MIYKSHFIELYINKEKADLESQKSLNLRFQNVLFNPEKISSSQAEYSFEFDLPSTPTNDKIFDYANNLSKVGKFRSRLNAEVYADGSPIFEGTLTLNGFKDKKYSCNLVSVKVYSLEDIFGDAKLTDIDNWKINFNGAETINQLNSELETDVVFPLVSYGAFQKSPSFTDEAGSDYTSKYDLDEYNKWYVESFYPSLSMLETLKHAFQYKGYKVGGDAFTDMFLKNIYMSTNLADGQSPEYNVGNPRFGKVNLNVSWAADGTAGYVQDLTYPYGKVGDFYDVNQGHISADSVYNFSAVQLYDVLEEGTVSADTYQYMYQPYEHLIVIPADGFYKIDLSVSGNLLSNSAFTAMQNVREWSDDIGALWLVPEEKDISITPDFKATTPLEIQLVRNYDDNLELIKGKYNMEFIDGYPDHATIANRGDASNYYNTYGCFPHEKLGKEYEKFGIPTNPGDLTSGNNFMTRDADFGYVNKDSELMMFDQVVSPSFICGFSTMGNKIGGGQGAVMKNGYSWSKLTSEKDEAFYPEIGYQTCDYNGGNYSFDDTTHNYNTYINCPAYSLTTASTAITGSLSCMVYLKKNDVLQLFAVHRDYNNENGDQITYRTSVNANLTIEAFSNRSYDLLKATNDNRYDAPTEFDTQLNLANFMNKEKKISEWVQNVADAFNLDIIQNGYNVEINTKKKFNRNLLAAVELDNRVNSENAEVSKIDYPRSMAVKYKIDTDEHGFYNSVPADKIDLPNWKDFGDSGYSVVQLNDDTYTTSTSDKNLQFSYTWYDDFNWYAVNSAFTKTSTSAITLNIPVISKEQYMIDGYDYTESLKHDGYGLAQRFWFRPNQTNCYVWTRNYPTEQIFIYEPKNLYTNYRDIYMNLSYKITENSLLKQYFNFTPYLASNYVEVEAYITPDEYNMLKNGSLVHLDSDIYYTVEINGYDCTGYNPTKLKLMKKL